MKDRFSQFTSKVTNLRRDRKEIVDELIEVKNKWLNARLRQYVAPASSDMRLSPVCDW